SDYQGANIEVLCRRTVFNRIRGLVEIESKVNWAVVQNALNLCRRSKVLNANRNLAGFNIFADLIIGNHVVELCQLTISVLRSCQICVIDNSAAYSFFDALFERLEYAWHIRSVNSTNAYLLAGVWSKRYPTRKDFRDRLSSIISQDSVSFVFFFCTTYNI